MCKINFSTVLKKNYEKPQIDIALIRIESSIANSSVHLGPTTGQYAPEVEDFEEYPELEGIGDL